MLLKVRRKKSMVEITASCEIVPHGQSFPDLKSAIVKLSQRRYFSNELEILGKKGILNKNRGICKLDQYLDRCGLLRVDDRIQKSVVSEKMKKNKKQPVLKARNSKIAVIIIR